MNDRWMFALTCVAALGWCIAWCRWVPAPAVEEPTVDVYATEPCRFADVLAMTDGELGEVPAVITAEVIVCAAAATITPDQP